LNLIFPKSAFPHSACALPGLYLVDCHRIHAAEGRLQLSTDSRRPFPFTRPNAHNRISQVTSAGDSIEAVDSLNRSHNCLLQNRENEYGKDYCGCASVA